MPKYWIKTPWWLKLIFPKRMIWEMPAGDEPAVYLTFDDGPHPTATPFVLDQLATAGGKGTFFCVGNNVRLYEEVYNRTIAEGHTTGNHTYNHINGWRTIDATYIRNIKDAARHIDSRIFRPPYGRIKYSQMKYLCRATPPWKIYMWDVLSGDFDKTITGQQCTDNVLQYIKPGYIVIFHDSEKAWERMQYALPRVIQHCQERGWQLKALPK